MLNLKTAEQYAEWAAAPERARSGEVDFGVMWTLGAVSWPQWRVSWIKDTGELYAKELGGQERFAVLGHVSTRAEVEQAMTGWAEYGGHSVSWIMARIGGQ